jgi:hypothetical protein
MPKSGKKVRRELPMRTGDRPGPRCGGRPQSVIGVFGDGLAAVAATSVE